MGKVLLFRRKDEAAGRIRIEVRGEVDLAFRALASELEAKARAAAKKLLDELTGPEKEPGCPKR